MNNEILKLVGQYLVENPETATRIVAAARQSAERRERRDTLMRQRAELVDSLRELDAGVAFTAKAVNALKGDLLRLQKERKRVADLLAFADSKLADLKG